MSIILNENEWASDMIRSCSLGEKPFETLRRIARYYMDEGYSPIEARKKLDSFLLQCEPGASLPKWSKTLDTATKSAARHTSIDITSINITDAEMKRIDSLDGKQIKRLAFTLLCIAKYRKVLAPDNDYWVNTDDNKIMAMANINTSIKRQCAMYRTLREAGMVLFSKKVDNVNVKVCFAEDGDTVLPVTDFRNLGYQYMMYHGETCFICSNCGITEKIDNPGVGRKQKYCKKCAAEIAMQQRIDTNIKRKILKNEKKMTWHNTLGDNAFQLA